MKSRILIFLGFLVSSTLIAQTKVYVSVGTNFNTGIYIDGFYAAGKGNYNFSTDGRYVSHDLTRYLTADILFERRINKTIYGVSGIMLGQAGYQNSYLTNYSDFHCTYVGIPMFLRLNIANGYLMDIGPVLRIPVNADLNETALLGSPLETSDHQDVSRYLSPFSIGWAWQNTFMINRFSLTLYFMGGKTQVSDQLEPNWKINGNLRNNSLFLRDIQPKYLYQMLGIKVGLRIR